MAEKAASSREAIRPIARRPSFRKTLKENEGALPQEYLDALEQKRRQLDESIHKYVASKEREYKQYEKDVKQQARAAAGQTSAAAAHGSGTGNGVPSSSKRRTSSESTQDMTVGSPFLQGRDQAVGVLLASQARKGPAQQGEGGQESQRSEMSGLADRRDSEQREKEFVGLFTPQYLPAIDDKGARKLERADSAPGNVESSTRQDLTVDASSLPRAESDTTVQAKAKRPAHLQLSQRTSSSGSSADGKLASAMKSPTQPLQRPKRKRVSLAVGDSIVAPSDNVPSALSNSTTPSHSRTRSPETEREHSRPVVPTGPTTSFDFAKQPVASISERVEAVMTGSAADAISSNKEVAPMPERVSAFSASPKSSSKIDADGDLFDLEDESDVPHKMAEDDFESAIEEEDEMIPGIAGRVEHSAQTQRSEASMKTPGLRHDGAYDYDPEAGLVPEPGNKADHEQPVWDEATGEAEHLEFGPGPGSAPDFSSSSSQQPTNPGFRRPSVVADPVFKGPDYVPTEARAATEEIYGSSFSRPGKGSFTAGSLGESYMHENMMKLRLGKKEQEVR